MTENTHKDERPFADVGAQRIARVYAEALLQAADRHGHAESVLEELRSFVEDVFAASPNFEEFLASKAIGRGQKAPVIRSAFEGRASAEFLNFLLVLNDHDRLELLRAVLAAYRALLDQRAHRLPVLVRSAVPLADDQRQRLENELRETFRYQPVLETRVEPELLGGMVVEAGDWLYDASVRTRIQTIRNQLMERSNYEIQSGRNRFSS